MIIETSEGERFDRFVQCVQQEVQLEVLKTQAYDLEEVERISLRIDSAMWSFKNFWTSFISSGGANDSMEIWNIQPTNYMSEE